MRQQSAVVSRANFAVDTSVLCQCCTVAEQKERDLRCLSRSCFHAIVAAISTSSTVQLAAGVECYHVIRGAVAAGRRKRPENRSGALLDRDSLSMFARVQRP